MFSLAGALLGLSFLLSVQFSDRDFPLSSFFSFSFLKVDFGCGVFSISSKIANGVPCFCFVDAFVREPTEQFFV